MSGETDTTATATTTTTAAATDTTASTTATETATDAANPQKDGGSTATETTDTVGAPEAYEAFQVPEGMTLDEAAVAKFAPVFKENGLTQAQAQALVNAYAEQIKAQQEGAGESAEQWYAERRAAEVAKANEDGIAALKSDTELGGGNFDAVRTRVIEAVGATATPEFRDFVNANGLGNHPEFVRLVNRLIDYSPEDRGERGDQAGASPKTPREVLWGNTEKS